jgi:hypothetical protein
VDISKCQYETISREEIVNQRIRSGILTRKQLLVTHHISSSLRDQDLDGIRVDSRDGGKVWRLCICIKRLECLSVLTLLPTTHAVTRHKPTLVVNSKALTLTWLSSPPVASR